jgi:hypothetical protein
VRSGGALVRSIYPPFEFIDARLGGHMLDRIPISDNEIRDALVRAGAIDVRPSLDLSRQDFLTRTTMTLLGIRVCEECPAR